MQVLINALPGFASTCLLHDSPNSGNPFALTIGGTVIIQLLERVIAIVPVLLLTKVAGSDLVSIYVHKGVTGK